MGNKQLDVKETISVLVGSMTAVQRNDWEKLNKYKPDNFLAEMLEAAKEKPDEVIASLLEVM